MITISVSIDGKGLANTMYESLDSVSNYLAPRALDVDAMIMGVALVSFGAIVESFVGVNASSAIISMGAGMGPVFNLAYGATEVAKYALASMTDIPYEPSANTESCSRAAEFRFNQISG